MPKKSPNDIDLIVGRRVKQARFMAKLSQENLGDKLGVSFQQIQKYEKGANRIAPSRLLLIAQATGQPVWWFYGDNTKAPATESIVERMMTTPYGSKLAEAYLAIEDNQDRRIVFDVANALANASVLANLRPKAA